MLLVVILFAPSYVFSFDDVTGKWQGDYSYNAFLGRTVGGDAILYGVTLTISTKGTCKVEEDGFQLMSRISCYMSRNNSGINIHFKEYLPDNIVDFGYKKGERLFSLKYRGDKALITTWGSLKPDVKLNRGVFFKKVAK